MSSGDEDDTALATTKPGAITVKRFGSKEEIARLLACLEGELQARDEAVSRLRDARTSHLMGETSQSGFADPYLAFQRDAELSLSGDFDENALKLMYDSQLAELENLIATQRKAQQKIKDQLVSVERKYHNICTQLEDAKRVHERDTAQGDDVLAGLEKDRERLRSEVEFEKSHSRRLEKECRKTATLLNEEQQMSGRQRSVALQLIRDKRSLTAQLKSLRARCLLLEAAAFQERSQRDSERASLVAQLEEETKRNQELEAEVERLRALYAAAIHPANQPKVKPAPPLRRTPVRPQKRSCHKYESSATSSGSFDHLAASIGGSFDDISFPTFNGSNSQLEEQQKTASSLAEDNVYDIVPPILPTQVPVYLQFPQLLLPPGRCYMGMWNPPSKDCLTRSLNQFVANFLIKLFSAHPQLDLRNWMHQISCNGVSLPFNEQSVLSLLMMECNITVHTRPADLKSFLALSLETGFNVSFVESIVRQLLTSRRVVFHGPPHCCKRYLLSHLVELMRRSGYKVATHNCISVDYFSSWLQLQDLTQLGVVQLNCMESILQSFEFAQFLQLLQSRHPNIMLVATMQHSNHNIDLNCPILKNLVLIYFQSSVDPLKDVLTRVLSIRASSSGHVLSSRLQQYCSWLGALPIQFTQRLTLPTGPSLFMYDLSGILHSQPFDWLKCLWQPELQSTVRQGLPSGTLMSGLLLNTLSEKCVHLSPSQLSELIACLTISEQTFRTDSNNVSRHQLQQRVAIANKIPSFS